MSDIPLTLKLIHHSYRRTDANREWLLANSGQQPTHRAQEMPRWLSDASNNEAYSARMFSLSVTEQRKVFYVTKNKVFVSAGVGRVLRCRARVAYFARTVRGGLCTWRPARTFFRAVNLDIFPNGFG